MQLRIKMRIDITAAVVILDDVFDPLDAAVVHIRSRACDFAQSRRFESAAISFLLGNGVSSIIRKPAIAPGDAGVVKLFISKVRPDMTSHTVRLAAK